MSIPSVLELLVFVFATVFLDALNHRLDVSTKIEAVLKEAEGWGFESNEKYAKDSMDRLGLDKPGAKPAPSPCVCPTEVEEEQEAVHGSDLGKG